MPSPTNRWSRSSDTSAGVRIAAALAVVAVHAAAVGTLFFSEESTPQMLPQEEAIMVSVIEAPVPEQAKAESVPETPPEVAPPEPPPPEPPPPEVQPEETPDTPPDVTPDPEPDPEPPPPVVEKPPEPAPKPKPKPAPKPKPKPVAKPVQVAPTPPAPPPPAAVSGNPDGATKTQAPQQAPTQSTPEMVTTVEYLGKRPMPVYPSMSTRLREQGRVVVLVDISTQGEVSKASIDTSSGFARLDEAALDAARKARFKPLTRNGVAFPARAKLPFDFVMRN